MHLVTTLARRVRRHFRDTSLGQSLAEFALVAPILLLILGAAADFGRAFYGYVAIENAAKEGAFFGSRNPFCDDSASQGCGDPNNVIWHVRNEVQNLTNPDGTPLTPTIECLAPGGTPRADIRDCVEGDTYEVIVVYPFRLLTPLLGNVLGNPISLSSGARAVVLNQAFDPNPGASAQKLVSPSGAVNESDIVARCLEPDDFDSAGYYRSPCRDSSTPNDPSDVVFVTFQSGDTVDYKVTVANSGAVGLSGVTINDSQGWPPTSPTCPARPNSLAVGATYVCEYSRTAPTVPGAGSTFDHVNQLTVDAAEIGPAVDAVTVRVERPPAMLRVLKWVSPFRDGNDGDGNPSFGTLDTLSVTFNAQVPQPSAWHRVIVINTGGQTATGIQILDTNGILPFGQNDADSVCDPAPATLAAGAQFVCRYRVDFTAATVQVNTVTATSPDVTPDSDDQASDTITVAACPATNRVVPNLIGLQKAAAQAAWTAAGFTTALTVWNGQPNATVVTQNRPAFECVPASSAMTVTRDVTP
jgi:hypothetical protein